MTTKQEQEEIDAMLLDLVLKCARPSIAFRLLFNARERQLIGFAVNSFMGVRQTNLMMNELDRRYGPNAGANRAPQTDAA